MGMVTLGYPFEFLINFEFLLFSPPKISLERLQLETSNLMCMLIIASPSLRTTNYP